MAGGDRCAAECGCGSAGVAVQHYLLVRHDGHTEGDRAAALHALGPRATRPGVWLCAGCDHAAVDTAVLEHDAGVVLSDHGDGWGGAVDGEVRRAALPDPCATPSSDAHDAGARAIPAHHGAAGFRPLRSVVVSHEALDERAVPRDP